MLSLLAPILVFGLVIFVHELGHFLAAKAVGVYAPRFSIGFGPALFRFRRGETEYILAALPLGGYVRMASRLDEETAFLEGGSEAEKAPEKEKSRDWDPEAMIPFGPKPVPEHRWFESKPLIARLFIMIAGVTMNAILTILVIAALVFKVGRTVVPTTVVGEVVPLPTIPALAGLRLGDTIRAIDGKAVASWNDVRERIAKTPGPMTIATHRGTMTIPIASDNDRMAVMNAVGYHVPAVVDSLMPGSRALEAGMRPGDSIASIAGRPVRTWADVAAIVVPAVDTPLEFDIVRGGVHQTLTITPQPMKEPDPATGRDTTKGKIGAWVRDPGHRESVGLGRALVTGTRESWSMAANVAGFLKKLVVGEVSFKQLGGPIAITRASVNAARSGVEDLFYLIALLSINVAVLNLLPIPILDGGQILLNVIESAKGSPFSLRTREYILRFGLAAIALLFIVVMFNDTREGLAKLVGWVFK